MKPIFPKYAFGSVNLPVWENNVIRFLSDHRKYRILWWEFGPTLLDYLHRVKEPDYTKSGLILTYSIASIVALASFTSTRKAAFTAAVTSGVILLGIATTVAIDYQRTKRQNNDEIRNHEYYFELLTLLGETPQYWWWPWSRKIKDIKVTERQKDRAINYNDYSFTSRLFYSLFTNVIPHQFYATRCGYLYNYQKLGGKMPFGLDCNWFGQAKQPICDTENKLEVKSNNLIRKILSVDNESNITLKKALTTLQFGWLLHHLDESLKSVRMGAKTKEEHDQYCKKLIAETQRLSLIYHSDKKNNRQEGVDAGTEQRLINEAIKALRNVHKHVMEKHNKTYNKYYGVYRLYGELPMKELNDDKKDIFSVVKVSPFDGRSVLLSKLGVLASYEEGELMSSRNEYIGEAKKIVRGFQDILKLLRECKKEDIYNFAKKKKEEFDQRRNSERYRYSKDWVHEVKIDLKEEGLETIKKIIDVQEKAFNQYEKDYPGLYSGYWVEQLQGLSRNCQEYKELEVIKEAVEELYNESKEQHKILIGKGRGVADSLFVQPILSYRTLVKACHKFVMGLYDDIVKKNKVCYGDLQYALSETGVDSKFVKESKEGIEKLSEMELLDFLNEMVNNYYQNGSFKSLGRRKVKRMMSCFTSEDGSDTEMIHLIVFMLNHLEKRFDDKFKKQETYFDRREKEERESKARSEELKKMLEEAEQRAEQALVGQAASFMRIAESSSDKNKMIIYQARVRILKDLLMLCRETNSRGSLCLSDDKVYQAREEVYTIHEEMHELVKEIGRDVVLNSITRAEDLVKKSGTIMLNLKKYKLGEEDYKRLEQEVNNLIEQEAQRAEQETQRAEQIKIVGGVFTKKMFKLNDKELRDVIMNSYDEIVEEIVGHVMKHDSSPKQVLDAIIEEVISNRDQVMKEGAVGDELINKALEEMNETEVDLSTFFQDVDVSQGATAKIQK